MFEKYVKIGAMGFLAAGIGACIGQRVGFKKADKTMINISNVEEGLCTRVIDGVEYIITVTKKED